LHERHALALRDHVMLNEVKYLSALQRGFKEMFRFAQHEDTQLRSS